MTTNDSNEPKLADVEEQLVDLKRQIKSIRKMLCLVLVILILTVVLMVLACLGGCQIMFNAKDGLAKITGMVTETPSAKEELKTEPVPTPSVIMQEVVVEEEQNVAKGNGLLDKEESKRIAKEYVEKYFPHEKYDSFQTPGVFQYTIFPQKGDFSSINPEFLPEMYTLPYNFASKFLHDNADSKFLTNKKTIAKYGLAQVEEWAAKTKRIAELNNTWDVNIDTDNLREELETIFSQERTEGIMETIISVNKEYGVTQKYYIETDPSMVYIAADGSIRVRLARFFKIISANEKYYADNLEEQYVNEKEWMYDVEEYILAVNKNGVIEDVPTIYQLFELRQADSATITSLNTKTGQ